MTKQANEIRVGDPGRQVMSGVTTSESGDGDMAIKQWNDPNIELRTAHDVRKLVGCSYCAGIGNTANMIREGKASYIHGRCFAARDGLYALLALPKEMTDRLTIADIGGPIMKALLK